MRRMILLVSFVTFVLASCGLGENRENGTSGTDDYVVANSSSETVEGDFVYRLVSEEEEYLQREEVKIYAELEYIGDKEEITIYHAASPFYFPMKEKTREYSIEYAMNEPLLSTTLTKGEPLQEYYQGSGGYGSNDDKDYINFMKKIMKNKFPVGYYEVLGSAEFFVEISENENGTYKLNALIDFKVKN
ncbi:hypothetical protein [Bacillus sp. FJAT-45350]|uniref:hypothetical protein n=1 Tax=Bacillus sp. FJAT-45350 TaxID=2011014 RepID=UPI000BB96976|nr:hypothetical protein [Bacillus sp. FJAT-45350]